jgi:hypothetical protein
MKKLRYVIPSLPRDLCSEMDMRFLASLGMTRTHVL